MKSALGEYVHYYAKNYLTYGTSRINSLDGNDWQESYKAQRAKNESRLNALKMQNEAVNRHLQELEEIIRDESTKTESEARQQYNKNFQEALADQIEKFQNYLLEEVPTNLIYKTTVQQRSVDATAANITKAQRVRRQIYKQIDAINRQAGRTIEVSKLDKLMNSFDEFFSLIGLTDFRSIYKKTVTTKNTLVQLQQMIGGFQLESFNKAALQGKFGEELVKMCGGIAQARAGQAITANIQGDDRTIIQIDETMIEPAVQQEILQRDNYNVYQARYSQDKVDVSIAFSDATIDTSVKNYSATYRTQKIHLQKNINLIYQLLASESEFGNHWLNLHALNLRGQSRTQMDEVLTDSLRYEALVSGNLLKSGSSNANAFIAIDTARGKVFVSTTYDLLTTNKNNFSFRPTIDSIDLSDSNRFQLTVEERIATLLAALRKKRVTVSYRAQLV